MPSIAAIILGKKCECCRDTIATQHDPEVGAVCSECQGYLTVAEHYLTKPTMRMRSPQSGDEFPVDA